MEIAAEIDSVGVVLRGHFNPAILTPAWFGWQELLTQKEVENAELQITHPEISSFGVDWFHLDVRQDQFNIDTTQPPEIRIRDLVLRIFGEKLDSTPITALGINRNVHFLAPSFESRVSLGRLLVPTEPWAYSESSINIEDDQSGMSSLTVSQINPPSRPQGGRISVTIEPSKRVGSDGTGIYVGVNDHYAVENSEDSQGSSEIMRMLDREFETSVTRSNRIICHIMRLSDQS